MCLHVLTKTLPFKIYWCSVIRLLNSQWKMHREIAGLILLFRKKTKFKRHILEEFHGYS